MRFLRLPIKDPRTVARDIPGIFDILFPQLIPSITAYINHSVDSIPNLYTVSDDLIKSTSVSPAMLFEVAYSRAEKILKKDDDISWDSCLSVALKRQSRYFDAVLPESLTDIDINVAEKTANNLVKSIFYLKNKFDNQLLIASPKIYGYHWISNSYGDFSIGNTLIEVKCTSSKFSSNDIRQLLIYWLLNYAASLENKTTEWTDGVLLNPRLNIYVTLNFNELIKMLSGGKNKIEILQLFKSLISDYETRIIEPYE